MALVLTEDSRIACGSNGVVSKTGQSKLKVSGGKVLLLDGVSGKTISGCTVTTDTNTGTVQCQSVASVSGVAAKLKVSAAAVLLQTATGTTTGVHVPPTPASLSFTANQTKLKAS